jgi:hypothetical protein
MSQVNVAREWTLGTKVEVPPEIGTGIGIGMGTGALGLETMTGMRGGMTGGRVEDRSLIAITLTSALTTTRIEIGTAIERETVIETENVTGTGIVIEIGTAIVTGGFVIGVAQGAEAGAEVVADDDE